MKTGTKLRVLSIWGLGSGLVSQVPSLGDAIGVVGVKKSIQDNVPLCKNAFMT